MTERKMKDSGIPWIGMIPEEWEVCRFKDTHDGTNVGESIDKQYWSEDISLIPFYSASITPTHTNYNDFPEWKYTKSEDLLLSRNGTPYVYLPIVKAAYTDHIIRVSVKNRFNKKFVKYCIEQSIQSVVANTVSLATWSASIWNEQKITLPPIAEQEAIAEWLDGKCGEIDELIEVEQKMIEELEAYRQATITEAVTRGLNPDVPMQNTNIHWAPNIPRHWSIKNIKQICFIMDYLREPVSSEQRSRNNPVYPYYGASGIIDFIDYYNVDDTVLLIAEDGANLRMRNLPLVYKASGKIWVNNHAHILKPKIDNYKFCAYVMEATDYSLYITGSAQPKLSQENIGRVNLPMPPLSEQQAIADYLDTKCKEIDELIAVKREKIETLKQYRQSIIFEAVTGKVQIN